MKGVFCLLLFLVASPALVSGIACLVTSTRNESRSDAWYVLSFGALISAVALWLLVDLPAGP